MQDGDYVDAVEDMDDGDLVPSSQEVVSSTCTSVEEAEKNKVVVDMGGCFCCCVFAELTLRRAIKCYVSLNQEKSCSRNCLHKIY